jgi:PIN domain nuclease of toxin-antitoxin system
MNALLDTHTFLWWVTDAPQLSETAKAFIADLIAQPNISVKGDRQRVGLEKSL